MIPAGGKTLHSEIHNCVHLIRKRKNFHSGRRNILLKTIKLTVIIIGE
jgi:hypothetical protein